MNKKPFYAIISALVIPYIITLSWTGTIHGEELRHEQQSEATGRRRILLDRNQSGYYMDVEDYLPGILARQMPADYEPEALRAQAIAARTYIYKQMGTLKAEEPSKEIPESALDMDYLETAQMKAMWGTAQFPAIYEKLESAVRSTAGMVMTSDGQYIDAMFCRASAGRTRAGDYNHPYLQPVDCSSDVQADGFLQLSTWTPEEFTQKINEIPSSDNTSRQISADQVPSTIQIISRDDSGYVTQVQLGGYTYTGEEIQYGLGLQSSCFVLESYDGNIRATVKGVGHGFGMSQAAANERAREGWKAEDILSYFYKNIDLISE